MPSTKNVGLWFSRVPNNVSNLSNHFHFAAYASPPVWFSFFLISLYLATSLANLFLICFQCFPGKTFSAAFLAKFDLFFLYISIFSSRKLNSKPVFLSSQPVSSSVLSYFRSFFFLEAFSVVISVVEFTSWVSWEGKVTMAITLSRLCIISAGGLGQWWQMTRSFDHLKWPSNDIQMTMSFRSFKMSHFANDKWPQMTGSFECHLCHLMSFKGHLRDFIKKTL